MYALLLTLFLNLGFLSTGSEPKVESFPEEQKLKVEFQEAGTWFVRIYDKNFDLIFSEVIETKSGSVRIYDLHLVQDAEKIEFQKTTKVSYALKEK